MSPQKTSDFTWDVKHLRLANEAAGVALWSWNVDTDEITMDDAAHLMWGVPNNGMVTFEDLSARIHPEDLDRVRSAFAATRDILGPYETDFRILHDDEIRWISARGRGDDQGIVGRVMFGVFLDVSVRKRAEDAREMIAHEMSHRIKNLFAVAAALTSIASRSTSTKEEMVHDLTQRLKALSDAHELVHTDFGEKKKFAGLGELLAVLLKPYVDEASTDRIQISAPEIPIGESSATALALIVHELATNSIKYGALSLTTGALVLSCTVQDSDVTIVWTETGGPPISVAPHRRGFGSQLITRSVSGQLGGAIEIEWKTEGAIATLRMSKARLEV